MSAAPVYVGTIGYAYKHWQKGAFFPHGVGEKEVAGEIPSPGPSMRDTIHASALVR